MINILDLYFFTCNDFDRHFDVDIVFGFEYTDTISLRFFINFKCHDSVIVRKKLQWFDKGPDGWSSDGTFFLQMRDYVVPFSFYCVFHKKTYLTNKK